MGYYDSVKDSVRENNSKNEAAGGGNFDTLKEKAEETSEEEDNGDDTPIEVLEEDGLSQENPNKQGKRKKGSKSSDSGSNPLTDSNSGSETESSQDLSSLEEKMDKMIEQNRKMIEILESFGQ